MPKKTKRTAEDLVRRIDFPHLREGNGKQWLQTGPAPKLEAEFSFNRLCFYAEKLRGLGMSDTDIACMFSDLYWDAVTEYQLNQQPH